MLNVLDNVFSEMDILRVDDEVNAGDTWQIGNDSFAILWAHSNEPRLWLIAQNDYSNLEHDDYEVFFEAFCYRKIEMPSGVLRLKTARWASEEEIKNGMRDGYLTPFILQTVKRYLAPM